MKATNYEISKQLAEAGFKSAINWAWVKLNGDLLRVHLSQLHLVHTELEKIIAYDLETILEALPTKIAIGEGRAPISFFTFTKNGMGYARKPQIEFQEFIQHHENESLADTAARLLLSLHKKNLIKF